jgi:hypothetical protein
VFLEHIVRGLGASATIRTCQTIQNPNATNTSRDAPRWLLPAPTIASLGDDVPERRMLCAWLDSWSGSREVIDAMNAHGYDARLRQSPFGWWAEFCAPESAPSRSGSAKATTPSQGGRFGSAALDALRRDRVE